MYEKSETWTIRQSRGFRSFPIILWFNEWLVIDGTTWLHVVKTVIAALLALGIAMLLELPSPKTAMTTVFVLMQPMSGMVLSKSFYRVLGTLLGLVAAIVIAALFPQTPELYLTAIAVWTAYCTAAAVRQRHFKWYAYVLAGYTAILIAIPTVTSPNAVYMSALTRVAEVAIGILCSASVSALIFPITSSDALLQALRARYADLTRLASEAFLGTMDWGQFEKRFGSLVDGMVGLEATRTFAVFEGPLMRSRSRRIARLNNEFSHACSRLHALYQLLRRLRDSNSTVALEQVRPLIEQLCEILAKSKDFSLTLDDTPSQIASRFRKFRSGLAGEIQAQRATLRAADSGARMDYDTATELLMRFVGEFIRYARTYESLKAEFHALERSNVQYAVSTNPYVVAFTFVRTVAAVGVAAWFWEATAWPSGGFAVIGSAIACALTSLSPNAAKQAWQIAIGTVGAIAAGYFYTCYVYPNIDGYPLLCGFLAPVLALGAYLVIRPGATAYGVGFSVFFCLLAGPDNVVTYDPETLINSGMAIVVSTCAAAMIFAVVFPAQMPWLIAKIERELRAQVQYAFNSELHGLDQRFHSTTHDIMAQLRTLLVKDSKRHRSALQWLLAILEVGHAAIDMRRQMRLIPRSEELPPVWFSKIDAVCETLSRVFLEPGDRALHQASDAVEHAVCAVQIDIQSTEDVLRADHARRILASLHFFRTVLLDKYMPFTGRDRQFLTDGARHHLAADDRTTD